MSTSDLTGDSHAPVVVSGQKASDIVLVDLGLGNLRSVEKSLELAAQRASAGSVLMTSDPDVVHRARIVVVPGQGAFRDGAAALDARGGAMRACLTDLVKREVPYFGICLGLQLLLETSDEAPNARGLGVFAGAVERIPDNLPDPHATGGISRTLKVPHMGWNQPRLCQTPAADRARDVLQAAGERAWFYFTHSYHAQPRDRSLVAATAEYGAFEVTAAIARGPLVATQFHPEKSQQAGLALLEAFLRRS